jgi:hypothetical protein
MTNNGEDGAGSPMGIDLLINSKNIAQQSQQQSQSQLRFASKSEDSESVRSIHIGAGGGRGRRRGQSDSGSDIHVVLKGSPRAASVRSSKSSASSSSRSSASSWEAPQKMTGAPIFQQPLSPDEILDKKREMLYQFSRLEKKGIQLPRKFSMSSSMEEMKSELDRIKRDVEVDASVRFQRRMLMACVSGIEFMNQRFDPLGAQLDGWSESVQDSINDYDDIFEELWEKYNSKIKMAPELRLLFSLGGSAVFFHISHSMFKTMPGVDQVFREHPELKKQFMDATFKTMNSTAPTGQAPSGPAPQANGGMFGGLGNLMGNLFGGGGGQQNAEMPDMSSQMHGNMRGPTDVDDILNELKQERFNRTDDFEIFSNASGMSDALSVNTDDALSMGALLQERKAKKGARKRRTLEL